MFFRQTTLVCTQWRGRIGAILTSLMLILAGSAGLAGPAAADISDDEFASTWGVRGLQPGQVTINYRVRSMVTIGDRVYVAGRFAEVVAPDGSTRDQSYIAAFNRDTGAWVSSFTPTFNAPIHSLAVSADGASLYVGGEFTSVDGTNQRGIVALNPSSGAVKSGFDVTLGATGQDRANVMAIEVVDDKLIIGGEWATVNGVTQRRVARISQVTGALDTSFTPSVLGGQVLAIEVSPIDGKVYLGGQFSSVDGDGDLRYFAALTSAGVPVTQPLLDDPSIYRPEENINVYSILEVGNTVFVGARSNLLFILDRTTLARQWHYGPELDAFNIDKSWHSSDFQALTLFDGAVYGGNHVRWIGTPGSDVGNGIADSRTNIGAPANTLTRFSTTGNHDQSFLPMELKGSVWAMTDAGDGCLWLGGNFDIPGKADWNLTRMCDTGPTLPYAPYGSATKFIQQQYLDFYGRNPTADEQNFWLASGAGDKANAPLLVSNVVASADLEIDRQVIRLYTGLFGRLPDQGGFNYWIGQRRAGLSLEDMVDAFLVSPEFRNLVGQISNRDFAAEVYRSVLDREPDKGGLDYWEDVLSKGFPRRELVVHFTESAEYVETSQNQVAVIVAYSSMLDRIPTAGELASDSALAAKAGSILPVVTAIFNGNEYEDRIALLPTGKL